jgi:multidrug efflux pump subunit AcrA (membrane-fusion protein)
VTKKTSEHSDAIPQLESFSQALQINQTSNAEHRPPPAPTAPSATESLFDFSYLLLYIHTLPIMTKLLKRIRGPLIIVVILVLLITVGLIRRQKPAQELLPTIPLVESATLAELEQTATTNHTSLVRSATSAPLITRNGGRVAHVNFNLGDTVNAGTIIAEIDNAAAGNPIVSQIAGLKKSLSILNNLLNITSTASNHAINSAELNLKSSQDNKPLTQEQANIARRQADNSRVQAEFGLEDANELGDDSKQNFKLIRQRQISI